MLFSEPKIPQSVHLQFVEQPVQRVSVLFSEPKIPQLGVATTGLATGVCFSALQRAENSSIQIGYGALEVTDEFQCSSASRKFLNRSANWSKLRRRCVFQCSSASRKFLNRKAPRLFAEARRVSVLFSEPKIPQFDEAAQFFREFSGFSALQRAENSSIRRTALYRADRTRVSVLFSEPKIPQFHRAASDDAAH